ncbi:MAG TPA: response regulator [Verrucomicrobiae bacterium]|jgi:two-component system response regulator|nr:response regulator [Verrucomicrobiae bacterium]
MPDPRIDTPSRRKEISRKMAASVSRGPILIVDDNPDDAKLAQRAFERLNPQFPINFVCSGRDLLNYLEGVKTSSGAAASTIPSVILLDLKMPEMDGFAILEWMAKRPQFAGIPVIILSTFDDLLHIKQAYSLGARSYLLKPITGDALRDALSSLNIAV